MGRLEDVQTVVIGDVGVRSPKGPEDRVRSTEARLISRKGNSMQSAKLDLIEERGRHGGALLKSRADFSKKR